jgi:ATP-binding cassette subfamily B protein
MDALKKYLEQQLPQILGQALSEPEFSSCWKNTEILEPSAGQLFWESTEAAKGIYLIVEGKVRLSDRDDN